MKHIKKIFVIGAGSWGTTMANHLSELGHNVTLCHKTFKNTTFMFENSKNKKIEISKNINHIIIQNNKISNIDKADSVCIAVPSNNIRQIIKFLPLNKCPIIVNLSKGIEISSLKTISQILIEEYDINKEYVVTLSGPTHAEEVIFGIPSALVVSSYNSNTSKSVQKTFNGRNLRVYNNNDILGVELGGSLKNVIAIAAGISDGLGFGDNSKASLVTRGCKEISELGIKLGANKSTFSGLSGIGDLIVTCFSKHSRNRFVGEKIGKGKSVSSIINEMKMVAEGLNTSKAVYKLIKIHNIELPICESVYNIIYNKLDPLNAVKNLINRNLSNEMPL